MNEDAGHNDGTEQAATTPIGVTTPENAVKTLRVIWAAVALGALALGLVLVMVGQNRPDPGAVSLGPVRVGVVALAVLIAGMGIGYYTRLQAYKAGWRGLAVSPAAYFKGNLIVFALLDAVILTTLILGAFVGDRLACYGIATAAFAALLLNFPNLGPMRQSAPRL